MAKTSNFQDFNECLFTGNITNSELTLTKTQNGVDRTKVSIAINKSVNGTNYTSYANLIAYGKHAQNIVKFLKKGSAVLVKCEYSSRSYNVPGSNEKKFHNEFVINRIKFLTTPKSIAENNEARGKQEFVAPEEEPFDPFEDASGIEISDQELPF